MGGHMLPEILSYVAKLVIFFTIVTVIIGVLYLITPGKDGE
jgi:hypothetical protein